MERGKPREREIQNWWESLDEGIERSQGPEMVDKCLLPLMRIQNMAYLYLLLIRGVV